MITGIKPAGFALLVLLVISLTGTASAARKAEWVDGIVTKAPHIINAETYIQVDGRLYKVLPDIQINSRYERSSGAFNERKAQLFGIAKDQKISIRVRHFEIIRIILH